MWSSSAEYILPDLFQVDRNWAAMLSSTSVDTSERSTEIIVVLEVNQLDVYSSLVNVVETAVVVVDDSVGRVREVSWRSCKYAADRCATRRSLPCKTDGGRKRSNFL